MRAAECWKTMIQLEHAQSDRFRGPEGRPADHWQAFAQQFRADPRRSDDPLVNRLFRELSPHETLIDVGAGGGRLALPLALNCRHVVAVEPSPSMASVLRDQIAEYSIHNLTVVASHWEDADVEEADVVLCVHVLYTIQEIERFVSKLQGHARKRVLIVLFQTPPQAQTYTLWQEVHGEERLPLPSLPEFQDVLSDMGITANVELLPAQTSRGFDDVQQAVDQLGRRLFLEPGSQKMARLESLLPGLLEPSDGAFILEPVYIQNACSYNICTKGGVRMVRKRLTDRQWNLIEPVLPGKVTDPGRTGFDNRATLEGILWIMRTGAPWRDLPFQFGKWITVYQRFRRWEIAGVFDRIFQTTHGRLDLRTVQVDGSFVKVHQHAAGAPKEDAHQTNPSSIKPLGEVVVG